MEEYIMELDMMMMTEKDGWKVRENKKQRKYEGRNEIKRVNKTRTGE